ncbi:TfoX/Sxy family DNA transformation protein [Candidatus Uhrbacteria bacterium]|nr:TfoX/Sxy family DNA transformation protein [Candidatus Uhrbacteria bacterium]
MKARIPTQATKLEHIPGIGPSLAQDLRSIDILQPTDLLKKDAEELYNQLEKNVGVHVDRCVLYTFRCAIYFMSTPKPEPKKCLWWNWKE